MGRGHQVVGGILLLIALLAATAIFIPSGTVALGVALLLALLAALTALSPTRTIIGSTRRVLDLALALGMLLLIAPDANALLGTPSELTSTFTVAPIGLLLLAIASAWATSFPVSQHSALWALRQRGGNRFLRWLLIFALALILTAGIAQPLARALAALHAAPLLAAGVAVALLIPLRVGVRFDHHRLAQGDMILLGASGLLVMRYALEALLPGLRTFAGLSWDVGMTTILATALSIIGLVVIALTPLSIWRSIMRLRATGDTRHLPNWPPWLVATSTGTVIVAVLFPLLTLSVSPDGSGWLLAAAIGPQLASRALIAGLIGAVLVGIIASLHDHARRLLIAIPLIAGLIGLGVFAYHAFVSSFLWAASVALYAITSGTYAAVLSASALFWANAILAITGFVAFLYEIGRD